MRRRLPVRFIALPLLCLALPLHAETVRQDRKLEAFERIELSAPFDVVWQSGPPALHIEGDKALLDRLELSNEGGRLRIGARTGTVTRAPHKLQLSVSSPSLVEARIDGSGDLVLRSLQTSHLVLGISGSGDLRAERVKVVSMELDVSGSGDLSAAGEAEQVRAALSGSGDVKLSGLKAREGSFSLDGSGDLSARVTQKLKASCAGSGDILIQGAPAQRDVQASGSCDIRFNP